jgi:hypothetical protein
MPLTTTPERFWGHVDSSRWPSEGCWEWMGRRDEKGYGRIGFQGQSNRRAHRVAFSLTFGSLPAAVAICHRCDNPSCCNPAHLFLGSQAENIADRHEKGRTVDPPSRRKLTLDQARAMRADWQRGGVTQQQLADRYGVSRGNVSKIVNGASYV